MTRPALDLTAKDCMAITLVGHDYATEHREYSVPSCLHIYLHAELAYDDYDALLSTITRFRLVKYYLSCLLPENLTRVGPSGSAL